MSWGFGKEFDQGKILSLCDLFYNNCATNDIVIVRVYVDNKSTMSARPKPGQPVATFPIRLARTPLALRTQPYSIYNHNWLRNPTE